MSAWQRCRRETEILECQSDRTLPAVPPFGVPTLDPPLAGSGAATLPVLLPSQGQLQDL